MSYDLFFFKKKESPLTKQQIKNYLTKNVSKPNAQESQWVFKNPKTGLFFSFETTNVADLTDDEGLILHFEDFENAGFLFNINFNRPDSHGLEAFPVVDRFIKVLDLYVLDPAIEASPHLPTKPAKNALYENWSGLNEVFNGVLNMFK